jgi:hypothetical protein
MILTDHVFFILMNNFMYCDDGILVELSMQWGPVNSSSSSSIHDSSTSVVTSSEGGMASLKNHADFLEGRDLSDQQMDKVLVSSLILFFCMHKKGTRLKQFIYVDDD